MRRTHALILGALVVSISACSDDIVGGGSDRVYADRDFAWSGTLEAGATLHVEGINGTIEVGGTDQDAAVSVAALLRVGAPTLQEARAHLPDLQVVIDTSSTEAISIRTDQPTDTGDPGYNVDYVVRVPYGTPVRIDQANGEVRLRDLEAGVVVRSANGTVGLAGCRGDIDADLANGDITASLRPRPGESIRLAVANGRIDLELATDASALFGATVGNGKVTVRGLPLTDTEASNQAVAGTLGDGEGEITLTVANGEITVDGD